MFHQPSQRWVESALKMGKLGYRDALSLAPSPPQDGWPLFSAPWLCGFSLFFIFKFPCHTAVESGLYFPQLMVCCFVFLLQRHSDAPRQLRSGAWQPARAGICKNERPWNTGMSKCDCQGYCKEKSHHMYLQGCHSHALLVPVGSESLSVTGVLCSV